MKIIELKDIKKIYKKQETMNALDDISIEIERGEFICIVGKSGSGKSTLLNIMGMLDKPTKGSYYFQGQKIDYKKINDLSERRNKDIGFVVQNFALLPDYTVAENIQIPLDIAKYPRSDRKKRVEEVLDSMEMATFAKKFPHELSGGQQQRVAIARAMVNKPKILLADEPTGALDSKTAAVIWACFEKINQEGTTVIIVTHELEFAKRCHRIIEMEDGKIKSTNN